MRLWIILKTLTVVALSVPVTVAIDLSTSGVTDSIGNEGSGLAAHLAHRAEIRVGGSGHLEAGGKPLKSKPFKRRNWAKVKESIPVPNVQGTHLGCSECSTSEDCVKCTETLQEKAADYRTRYEQQTDLRAKADALKAQHDASLKSKFTILSRRNSPNHLKGRGLWRCANCKLEAPRKCPDHS
ncbi:hypothetical protein PspLS_01815 [Pyricularia sp. CBS 133598]|nr:hypothetical protein PspLS_01815 [Pyricularia sp. CBS 133598]